LSKDNVDDLIAQMQAAVKSAVGASQAMRPISAGVSPAAGRANFDDQAGLINQLMLGVESRFGIKSGSLVERKLARILKDMPVNILRDWVSSMTTCTSEHAEWQSLVENLTVHETYFCRDPDLMEMVTNDVLPSLIASRESHQQLQVWSAASSTGEEVYDLAYICLKGLQLAGKASHTDGRIAPTKGWGLYVLGTDISNQALRTAREGVYGDLGMGSFRNLPQHWRAMFETVDMPSGGAMQGVNYFRIRDWVRQFARFERFNLMNARPPVSGMDLIFCRNVLIYFDDTVKLAVQKMLARAMSPGGVLVMGASVQLLATDYFESRQGRGGPWYVRNKVPL
jgi:chemotaxis protein methyltransferase CheR